MALFSGRTPEELRRLVQNDPTIAASPGGSGPEVFAKSMSGMILNQLTGDALRKLAGFDSASIEFGTGSLDFNLSKRFGRYIRTVGRGEWGFAGSTHLEGGGELRLSDYLKGLMRLEYLTRGVETQEESRTRLRFELNYRVPIR